MKFRYRRYIAALVVFATLVTSAPPQALAGLVGTEAAAGGAARERLLQSLSRAEVRARLEAYGAGPAAVQARVEALTDAEVVQLAEGIDALPAGGDGVVGAIVFVFLLLLITDIVGLTKVFPFTRSIR